jgi:hypothetical protein
MKHPFFLIDFIPYGEAWRKGIEYYEGLDNTIAVRVNDEFIQAHYRLTEKVRLYFNKIGEAYLNTGWNYHGFTIITPQMAKDLNEALLPIADESEDYLNLSGLLKQAVTENKYIIHFGV